MRIDERVESRDDVLELGINHGDIVAYDPKVEITDSGFIKSRFLDDKASVAVLLHVLKNMDKKPKTNLKFIFTTYEEVGHGAAYIPFDITEFLAVDMGCIGLDLACTEYDVSICAKDSSGPYDYDMVSDLAKRAEGMELVMRWIFIRCMEVMQCCTKGWSNIKAALIGPCRVVMVWKERTLMH